MTAPLTDDIFVLFLLFCRIGGCVMFAPGLSSLRIPVQIRLFVTLGVTAAISPVLFPELSEAVRSASSNERVFMIFTETLIGSAIGLMARFFLMALQFAATAISNFIGLAGIPGLALEDGDTGSPLATLVSSAAVVLIMTMGLHIEMLKGVIESYNVIPIRQQLPIEAITANLLKAAAETWLLALRLCGPFLLYGVVVNFALGLGNRFAQQISVYHATTGAVILGGFLLFYLMWIDWILIFLGAYQAWVRSGGF
ncbi:MAG: flagellar biosynthetic protein FliR [Aestuariivirga sp.]|uniref:flagellar biosynthetic protein FliR n=1 Tax=Aestuariivirga sp. TaxID=2650926 RepID=UPI0038D10306